MFILNIRFQISRQARRAYLRANEVSRLIERQLRQINHDVELQNRANRIKKKNVQRKRNLKKRRMTKKKKIKADDNIFADQFRLNVFMINSIIDTEKNTKCISRHDEIVVVDSEFLKTTSEN